MLLDDIVFYGCRLGKWQWKAAKCGSHCFAARSRNKKEPQRILVPLPRDSSRLESNNQLDSSPLGSWTTLGVISNEIRISFPTCPGRITCLAIESSLGVPAQHHQSPSLNLRHLRIHANSPNQYASVTPARAGRGPQWCCTTRGPAPHHRRTD